MATATAGFAGVWSSLRLWERGGLNLSSDETEKKPGYFKLVHRGF